METPHPYALWFHVSPFSVDTEPVAREAARQVLNRRFGAMKVIAAHDAALATGKRYVNEHGEAPEAVQVWLAAISEAYNAAWTAAGLPVPTEELYRDN